MSTDANITIGRRLQTERLRLRHTQAELAAIGEVTKTTQSNYETGFRSPDAVYLSKVAIAGIDIQYVVTGQHERPAEDGLLSYQVPRLHASDLDGQASVQAGAPVYRIDAMAVTTAWLKQRQLQPDQLRCISVEDASMQPVFQEGDQLLIDLADTKPKNGLIYVLRQGPDVMVKYLQALPGGRTRVFGANPLFPAYEIDLGSPDIRVVGRVVTSTRHW